MARKIMIASGKGGTGKSMVAVNLGATLAYHGYKTVVIDMCHGLRALDLYMGVESKAIWDLCDVINNICDLSDALLSVDTVPNLYIIPATQKHSHSEVTSAAINLLINELNNKYEFIIFDCPPGIGEMIDVSIECADTGIIVTTADYASLRDADAVEDKLIRGGILSRGYIVNSMSTALISKGVEMPLKEIDSKFRCKMLGIILLDENIKASVSMGVPIVAKRDSYIAKNFSRIAGRIADL